MESNPLLLIPDLPEAQDNITGLCRAAWADASGAACAARAGLVVVIVDVIDMSTTLEAALEAGAASVYAASPQGVSAPVTLDPAAIGLAAGRQAATCGLGVIVVAEPRVGTAAQREERAAPVLSGLAAAGVKPLAVIPNLGAETVGLADFKEKIVVAVTASGGTAFDAAWQAGARPLTATVARTPQAKGMTPALRGVTRALALADRQGSGIAFVAASSNSLEDILAARYLCVLASILKAACPPFS